MSETEPSTPEPSADRHESESSESGAPTEVLKGRSISRRRLIGVDILIGVTTLLAVVGIFAIWANRQLFSPDNWANTSTQLLQNPAIRSATANYLVDQLYANVDVAGIIKSGLPPQFQALAGPAAGALRNAAVQGTELALTRPRVQALWAQANRAADQAFIAIVNGGKGPVGIKNGVVTLDLASIVSDVASRLGLPSDLGSKLPASVGNLTIIKSDQLKAVQDAGNAIRGLALWLNIIVPLLYVLAIFLARGHRRRTLMSVGFSIILVGVIALLGRSILDSQVAGSLVKDASLRPAVSAVLVIGTTLLNDVANAFVIVGVVVVLAAWFAGRRRRCGPGRRAIAPFLREQPAWTFGITVAIMVLIFIWQPIQATGKPIGMLVFLALALVGTAALRRQTAEEFPDAQAGTASAAIRERTREYRERRRGDKAPAAATASVPEQIERLAALRDSGAITSEEYDNAKANVLLHSD